MGGELKERIAICHEHRANTSFTCSLTEGITSRYSGELMPKATSDEFITVPLPKVNPGEYMVIRPSRLLAIRVEPVFSSSVERF